MACRKTGQFRISGGQDDDISGGLLEINRIGSAINNARCGGEKMH
jgi:hypothetical protein